MSDISKVFRSAATGIVLAALAGLAQAQAYPARPITFLDNIPGGPQEALKRAVLAKMKDNTGATMVYEGRGGGGGAPGLQAMKGAAPDGYTFGLTYQSALTLNPLVNADLGIDPLRDYAPVSKIWLSGNVWTARSDHPAKDIRDLVAAAKAKPETIKIGVFGAGNRLFMAQLQEKTGAKFLLVPYKLLSDGTTAILGGQIDAAFDGVSTVLGQKERLKILAYGASPRLSMYPDTPTTRELYGVDTGSWVGILAPAKTPESQVEWVAREFVRAMRDPAILQIVAAQNYTLIGNSPSQFAGELKAEVEDNRALVKKYPDIR